MPKCVAKSKTRKRLEMKFCVGVGPGMGYIYNWTQ